MAAIAFAAVRLGASGFRWNLFASVLRGIDPPWTAAALVFILLTYVGRALRWRVMMLPLRPDVGLRGLISATAVGFTAVVFFGRPGEFVRPWLISVRERVPFSSQLAAWFIERIFDLLSVVLLFGFALTNISAGLRMTPRLESVLHAAGYLALSAGAVCVLVLIASAWFSETARRWCDRLASLAPKRAAEAARCSLNSFISGMQSTGSGPAMLRISLFTAAEWLIIAAGIYCLFHAFGPTSRFGWNDTLVFTGFVAFGSAVQLPGIGGGMQLAAILVLTELFALPLEAATACALLVWVATWLTIVPFGLLFAFTEGLHWSSLRRIKEEADAPAKSGIEGVRQ